MALVKGTSCGFVIAQPTANPNGTDNTFDTFARYLRDIAPAGATKITEIGWWCENISEESNFEVGLYDHNSGSNKPNNLIQVERTNAKGTAAGWIRVSVDWTITGGTTYWLAVQLNDTATTTNSNYTSSAGDYCYRNDPATTLPNPQTGGTRTEILYAIYAVYTSGLNFQINIGDVWKSVAGMQINMGTGTSISYETGDDNEGNNIGGATKWGAQTFTTIDSFEIAKIKVKLSRDGSPGTITASIKAVDGSGHPTGADLTSGTSDGDSLTDDPAGEWRQINLTPYTLLATTKYAIVLKCLDGTEGFYQIWWRGDWTSPTYSDGNLEATNDGGSSWDSYPQYEQMFVAKEFTAWKTIVGAKINIGDAWKTIF